MNAFDLFWEDWPPASNDPPQPNVEVKLRYAGKVLTIVTPANTPLKVICREIEKLTTIPWQLQKLITGGKCLRSPTPDTPAGTPVVEAHMLTGRKILLVGVRNAISQRQMEQDCERESEIHKLVQILDDCWTSKERVEKRFSDSSRRRELAMQAGGAPPLPLYEQLMDDEFMARMLNGPAPPHQHIFAPQETLDDQGRRIRRFGALATGPNTARTTLAQTIGEGIVPRVHCEHSERYDLASERCLKCIRENVFQWAAYAGEVYDHCAFVHDLTAGPNSAAASTALEARRLRREFLDETQNGETMFDGSSKLCASIRFMEAVLDFKDGDIIIDTPNRDCAQDKQAFSDIITDLGNPDNHKCLEPQYSGHEPKPGNMSLAEYLAYLDESIDATLNKEEDDWIA